ncbi:hypothetical protein J5N97_026414 [Dioscorea zingiberensis]|uniref:Subtilisin-like protease SBT5.3 n=1 Tax=Dioscorea zingiberensis TaxID=325984 RepID=A0A9D5C2A2_9LILI|nr:hypothetical protein J5N97_026414 [Dioscorea zingiberensis]
MKITASLLLAFFYSHWLLNPTLADKKSYIVYFGGHSYNSREASLLLDTEAVTNSHYDFLESFLGSKDKAQAAIFYSYSNYINGFAAELEEEEAMEISKHSGVVSVFPNRGHELHTTTSWEFLGLEREGGKIPKKSIWKKARFGEDTIIGNLDTGVWPESKSFNDDGIGPIPSRWRGICQDDSPNKLSCNRKLIGARYFNKGYKAAVGELNATYNTPRDVDGHGTHTLSTAAGAFVPGANLFGYANGTAKGGSPKARVAAYKVCWPPETSGGSCFDADIIAAIDAAIHDGVDVLSMSIGGSPSDYFQDGISIGSFHAVKNGVVVVASAGNSGPKQGTVSNTAPWIFTVAASTMDREFPSFVSFDGKRIKGQSLSTKGLPDNKFYPMISSEKVRAANVSKLDARLCLLKSLNHKKVKGKIVVCLRGKDGRVEKGEAVRQAGGIGMVLANDESTGNEIIADAHVLPAIHISYSDGLTLFSYLNSTKSLYGYITTPITKLNTRPAPFMAAFSSQGPNTVNPEILKPDITAPGVSVLAAYSKAAPPSEQPFDTRRVPFNVVSGTSMSCPHISGIVGLLKTLHPDWSPAAIRSAIMTTARTRDNEQMPMRNSSFKKATPFSYGAGHVRPNRAMDPGLIYDLTTSDYLNFLCSIGYNSTQITAFSKEGYVCPVKPVKLEDLNYPSITVSRLRGVVTVTRKVKNVGSLGTYEARIEAPAGVSVTVKPEKLVFDKFGEELVFVVTLQARQKGSGYVFGRLIWSDGKHYVRSPIVVNV